MQMITIILKVSDITFLSRESVRINFYQYFNNFVDTELNEYHFSKDYQAPFDTRWLYTIPYHSTQFSNIWLLFLIPIQWDYKCQEYTTNLLQLKSKWIKHKSITVFEDMSTIHSKTLARYVDVADKQFSSLDGNQEQIKEYISELVV